VDTIKGRDHRLPARFWTSVGIRRKRVLLSLRIARVND
jgi:hypothetical protein